MTTIVQLDSNDLQALIRQCLNETIEEIRTLRIAPELPDRMDIQQAADLIGLKRSAIYKLTMSGAIPFKKYGNRLVFNRQELNAWMDERTVRKQSPEEIASQQLARVARKRMHNSPKL